MGWALHIICIFGVNEINVVMKQSIKKSSIDK